MTDNYGKIRSYFQPDASIHGLLRLVDNLPREISRGNRVFYFMFETEQSALDYIEESSSNKTKLDIRCISWSNYMRGFPVQSPDKSAEANLGIKIILQAKEVDAMLVIIGAVDVRRVYLQQPMMDIRRYHLLDNQV